MTMLQWKFYIFLTPLLLLSAVLSIKEEKDSQKTSKYDLINFNDEEEDVLSKIERELRWFIYSSFVIMDYNNYTISNEMERKTRLDTEALIQECR